MLAGSVENFVGHARTVYGSVAANAANMTPELQARIRDLAVETGKLKGMLQHRKESFSSEFQEQLISIRASSAHQRELDLVLFLSTELTLRHEEFPTENSRDQHHLGWSGSFEKLAKLLEA